MGVGLLLMVTVCGSGLVPLVLGLLLWQRRTVALRRITARTTGTVSGYDFRGDGRAHPQVDFVVGSQVFQAELKYRGVMRVSGSFIPGSAVTGDPLAKTLRLRQNSRVSRSPIPEIFPLGSSLEVHYNPEDPRKNFAVRDRGALAGPLLTWGGVGLLVLGVGLGLLIGLG
ncbi:DUF3592 domain-containing protein [Citricoccus nitrophenolicus]|uniref:DUF3592 domain-containing protein n=1 Tax=Citricoccus nitrophenolicus TaxID=863575 RepID=A0ABV0IGP5_9MICC